MKILMKSALKDKEFSARKALDENNIEVQLFEGFYGEEISLDEYLDTIINSGLNISVIHTPLVEGEAVEIDRFYEKRIKNVFYKTCELSNMLGTKLKKNILVIVHCSMSFKEDIKNPNKIKLIDDTLLYALNKYSNISIAIENVTPIVTNRTGFYGRGGFLNDSCLYVSYFINKYGFKDRIGTVLDTCHALTTIKLLQYCKIDVTLEQYFDWNKQNVKLIHLANIGDNGYGKDNHGIGFIEGDDLVVLNDIMKLYFKYNYSCPITIEVIEKEYINPLNYLKTKENLLEILE
ncbi:hypothetical protein [Clostridium psychrophilum]|uniref:hypothetical protein n=1 Tax=Clostridium psychrophilum TaxID=132926 RepID=UPI001C0BE1C8|nr:hypothetical protein [Clostridium psychrophilum]MBU3182761.1 hypothetical protein [Clostridium psychrophilum]